MGARTFNCINPLNVRLRFGNLSREWRSIWAEIVGSSCLAVCSVR